MGYDLIPKGGTLKEHHPSSVAWGDIVRATPGLKASKVEALLANDGEYVSKHDAHRLYISALSIYDQECEIWRNSYRDRFVETVAWLKEARHTGFSVD